MATKYGTKNPDLINGTNQNDNIFGWAKGGNANSQSGEDTLHGAGGNDKVSGGTANDILSGGAGEDTLDAVLAATIWSVAKAVTFTSWTAPLTSSLRSRVESQVIQCSLPSPIH